MRALQATAKEMGELQTTAEQRNEFDIVQMSRHGDKRQYTTILYRWQGGHASDTFTPVPASSNGSTEDSPLGPLTTEERNAEMAAQADSSLAPARLEIVPLRSSPIAPVCESCGEPASARRGQLRNVNGCLLHDDCSMPWDVT
jgi:hypothetical protein